MKILLIGGTGTISLAVTKKLVAMGEEVFLLNRGSYQTQSLQGVTLLQADVNGEERRIEELLKGHTFDVVADFIAYRREQVERDYRLFGNRTGQFVFVSSASAYHKPAADYLINEGTSLANPYWEYSRNKIACEEYLMERYRKEGFPVTIVRPSHTYDERKIPVGIHGNKGSWQIAQRMLEGKPVIIHGDGTSLWTMTHSSDFANGFAGLLGNGKAIGEAVQITSDEVLTWNQIYQSLANALGVPLKPYHVASDFLAACSPYDHEGALLGDKANTVVFDNSKLKRLVPGFQAVKRFEQGIRESVVFYRKNPALRVPDPEFDAWCDRVIQVMEEAKGRCAV